MCFINGMFAYETIDPHVLTPAWRRMMMMMAMMVVSGRGGALNLLNIRDEWNDAITLRHSFR